MKKNGNYLDFFKDKNGKWAIVQFPNYLLIAWLLLTLLLLFITDASLKSSVRQLHSAILFAWAYLEVTNGESSFRRLFGAVALLYVVFCFFT